jgi:hypothetical protein
MSDHEFENYLALLTKLLRLDGKQREQMAGELRAHLEDRLDELLARGVPREEAVRLALEDFGDAAGLAAQFGSISRNRRRRWLMRVTTFSAAAMVLVAAGLAIFWPGRNDGPGVAAVVAQDPDEPKPAQDRSKSPEQPGAAPQQPRPMEWLLDQRMDADFEETPLNDVLKFIDDSTGMQFYVKRKQLDEAGVTPDTPITKHLRQVKVSTLLDLTLEELGLVYYEKDNLIVITTPEDAESRLEIRVYDCRDLLGLPAADGDLPVIAPAGGFGAPLRPGAAPGTPGAGPPTGFPEPGAAPSGGARGAARPGTLPKEIMPQFGGAVAPPGLAGPQAPAGGDGGFGGGGLGGGLGGGPAEPMTEEERRAVSLIDLLATNVDPNSWEEVGGPGSISAYHGLIVVTQTAQTHKKVERVLDMLREAAGLEVGGVKKVVR